MFRYRICLIVLCLIAAGMRLAWLDSAVLSRDEGSSWRVSRYDALDAVRHCAANVHPPLSFLLLKAWTGLLGDSVFAMRSLSALYGVLCVPLMYFMVLEAGRLRWALSPSPLLGEGRGEGSALDTECEQALAHYGAPGLSSPFPLLGEGRVRDRPSEGHSLHWGALAAAALVTCHPLQLEASRTARMYSLGALLALVSTLLLLWALRNPSRASWSWPAYAVAAAALAYTHNYGLLTIAAQLTFAFTYLLGSTSGSTLPTSNDGSTGILPVTVAHKVRAYATSLRGLFLAASLILVLYSPWLPVLRAQTAEVAAGYWIPHPTAAQFVIDLETWLFGERVDFSWAILSTLLAGGVVLVLFAMSRHPAALLFLLLAALPWVIACAFYVVRGQAILQLRYVSMAQVCLFALCGALVASPRFRMLSTFVVLVYLASVAPTSVNLLRRKPSDQPELLEMAAWLSTQHRPRDVVLVPSLGELARIQYYLARAPIESPDVLAEFSLSARGHTPYVGALVSADLLIDWNGLHARTRRVWVVSFINATPRTQQGWERAVSHSFGMLVINQYERIPHSH